MHFKTPHFGIWFFLEGEKFIFQRYNASCQTSKAIKSGSMVKIFHYLKDRIRNKIRSLFEKKKEWCIKENFFM